MVETHGRGAATRYRLHDLIRIFGLDEAARGGGGGEGCAALVAAGDGIALLALAQGQGDRGRYKASESLAAFDAERSNVEAALAQAADDQFPALVVAGRNLLRHRVDHGTRRSLLHKALKILDGAPSPPPCRRRPRRRRRRRARRAARRSRCSVAADRARLRPQQRLAVQGGHDRVRRCAPPRRRPPRRRRAPRGGWARDVPDLGPLPSPATAFRSSAAPSCRRPRRRRRWRRRRRRRPPPRARAPAAHGARPWAAVAAEAAGPTPAEAASSRRSEVEGGGAVAAGFEGESEDPRGSGASPTPAELYGADVGEVAAEAPTSRCEPQLPRPPPRLAAAVHPRPPRAAAAAGQSTRRRRRRSTTSPTCCAARPSKKPKPSSPPAASRWRPLPLRDRRFEELGAESPQVAASLDELVGAPRAVW